MPRPPSPKSPSPVGTRHRHKRHHSKNTPFRAEHTGSYLRSNTTSTEDLAACLKELESLPDLIKEKFTTWTDGAHAFPTSGKR